MSAKNADYTKRNKKIGFIGVLASVLILGLVVLGEQTGWLKENMGVSKKEIHEARWGGKLERLTNSQQEGQS